MIEHRHVAIGALRLHVAMAGAGSPLILLHGWPEFWAVWEPLIERLAGRFRLIAPDLRGFGESDNPHPEPCDRVDADVHADDLARLMEALGIERASLVGHDVGAYVMQCMAWRYPGRVSKLFFFNCPTWGVGQRWRAASHINEIWYQTFHQQPFAARLVGSSRENCRAYIGHMLRHWSYDKSAFDAVLERWTDNFMRPGNLQGGFNFYLSRNQARLAVMAGTAPKPPTIPHPTRVLWGRHDPILKCEWIDAVADAFDDVRADIVESCGHFVHYEQPDLAAAEVASFLG
ncbi:MAG: alpha/beta hydrolase [Geminicoccaceae bacterium]